MPVRAALPAILFTVVALVIVGIIKGRLASLNLFRSVIEIVVVGGASAAGGYLLGSVIPQLFGVKHEARLACIPASLQEERDSV